MKTHNEKNPDNKIDVSTFLVKFAGCMTKSTNMHGNLSFGNHIVDENIKVCLLINTINNHLHHIIIENVQKKSLTEIYKEINTRGMKIKQEKVPGLLKSMEFLNQIP